MVPRGLHEFSYCILQQPEESNTEAGHGKLVAQIIGQQDKTLWLKGKAIKILTSKFA